MIVKVTAQGTDSNGYLDWVGDIFLGKGKLSCSHVAFYEIYTEEKVEYHSYRGQTTFMNNIISSLSTLNM